jgi:hypothetical protein
MPILNYTTSIDTHKTGAEISSLLAKHGASAIATFYSDGVPSGIGFAIMTEQGARDFKLPANTDGVLAKLKSSRAVPTKLKTREQAARVAWRILKDWVEAQLAIIEAGMVALDVVMLPYMVNSTGQTFGELYQARGPLAIEAAS